MSWALKRFESADKSEAMDSTRGREIKQRVIALKSAWMSGGMKFSKPEPPPRNRRFHRKSLDPIPISYSWVTKCRDQSTNVSQHEADPSAMLQIRHTALPPLKRASQSGPEDLRKQELVEGEIEKTKTSSKSETWSLLQNLMTSKHRGDMHCADDITESERNLALQQIQDFLGRRKDAVNSISAEFQALVESSLKGRQPARSLESSMASSTEMHAHISFQENEPSNDESLYAVLKNTVELHRSTGDIVGGSIPEKDTGKAKALIKEFEQYARKDDVETQKPKNRERHKSTPQKAHKDRAHISSSLDAHRVDIVCREQSLALSSWNLIAKFGASKFDFTPLQDLCKHMTTNMNLTELNMSSCRIMAQGAAILAPALYFVTNLTALNLANNEIRHEGMAVLASCFLYLTQLRALSLYGNIIGDTGVGYLASCFENQLRLESLELGANQISAASLDPLRTIADATTGLSSLGLASNVTHFSYRESKGPDFAEMLSKSLAKLSTLTCLDLNSNSLFHSGAKFLARYLYTFKSDGRIKTLDLGGAKGAGNRIGSSGMKALSAALYWLPLTHLILSYNELGEEGAHSLSSALSGNAALVVLDLRGNGIGSNGAKLLQSAFTKNAGITYLDLAENGFCYDATESLANSISHLTSLSHLDLSSNSLTTWRGKAEGKTARGIESICAALPHHLHLLDLRDNDLGESCRSCLVNMMVHRNALTSFNGLNLKDSVTHWKAWQNLQDFEILFVARRISQLGIKETVSNHLQFNVLDLSGCGLLNFPEPVLKLKGLETLNLSQNYFRHIPIDQILKLRFLCRLDLKACPYLLQPPPYAANQSADVMLNYLQGCRHEGCLSVPVLLIGDHTNARDGLMQAVRTFGAGPAFCEPPHTHTGSPSLCRRVARLLPDEVSDNVHELLVPGADTWFELWDLGSISHLRVVQDFMFVARAVYTLCLDGDDAQLGREVQTWLGVVAKAVPRAPVVVVLVHDEEASAERRSLSYELVSEEIQAFTTKDVCLLGVTKVVSITRTNLEGTAEYINELVAAKTELLGNTEWVHSKHLKVLDAIRAYKASHPKRWIPWRDFQGLLEPILPDRTQLMIATEYLHTAGAIRCLFRRREPSSPRAEPGLDDERPVGDMVFLRPAMLVHELQSIPVGAGRWTMAQLLSWTASRHGAVGPYLTPSRSARRFVHAFAAVKRSQAVLRTLADGGGGEADAASDAGVGSFDPNNLESFLPDGYESPDVAASFRSQPSTAALLPHNVAPAKSAQIPDEDVSAQIPNTDLSSPPTNSPKVDSGVYSESPANSAQTPDANIASPIGNSPKLGSGLALAVGYGLTSAVRSLPSPIHEDGEISAVEEDLAESAAGDTERGVNENVAGDARREANKSVAGDDEIEKEDSAD